MNRVGAVRRIAPLMCVVNRENIDGGFAAVVGGDFVILGLKVLVVDDEVDSRELITAVLLQCEAVVTTVSSAREALAAIARVQSEVLMSDIGMPEEDGYSLIKKVRGLRTESKHSRLASRFTHLNLSSPPGWRLLSLASPCTGIQCNSVVLVLRL